MTVKVCLKQILRIIINKKVYRKILLKSKIEETEKSLYKPTKNSLCKLKRGKIKKSLHKPAKKTLFKSKINEIRNFFFFLIKR